MAAEAALFINLYKGVSMNINTLPSLWLVGLAVIGAVIMCIAILIRVFG
ncbi:hypothetical protein J970_1735 [Acinetobacter baumannii 26016_4]|nr:hypothetical protein J970_1735 [Acinetobacter baumannii 26016_4]